ncbi:MAG: fused MFS/spermidine synthase [Deltaproteobacteria bacterium]|nr:fused MFS/spermidine synthase [Deltaproteobacteria bacterium]
MIKDDKGDPAVPPVTRRYLPWLLILFVGSGCAALIYEVVWLQLVQLVIGSSGISLGVLLGIFMGGMCLGSLLLPRLISADHHPLRVYAFLEIGIGIFGIAILFGLPLVAEVYEGFVGHGIAHRAFVAAVCILPPTIMMGATLPAIARWVKATPEGVSWMGFFYAGNIVGGVLGCLLAGFYLLRVYDMPTGTYVGVAINVSVALVALIIASKTPYRHETDAAQRMPAEEGVKKSGIYIIIGLSGLCALGAEVIWTRLLSLMLGATVYTFSIILAVFLAGLGIGSSIGAFWASRAADARAALGACQMLIAGATAWGAFMITGVIPYWWINPIGMTEKYGPVYTFILDLLRAGCAVIPAAVLWGASFPLALASVAGRNKDSGRMVGSVYAANTVGAIIGSLGFSMLIIPQAGTQWGQRLIIILAAVSAMVAFWPSFTSRQVTKRKWVKGASVIVSRGKLAGAFVSLLTVALLVVFVSPVPWIAVAFGRYSASWVKEAAPGIFKLEDVPASSAKGSKSRYCIYVGEGMNVSVAVEKSTDGDLFFHGAGKIQASSNIQDMRLQRMLGHLSVLATANPDDVKDVLVVACGAGVTAGSFIPYPFIKRITICDIEPLVPKVVTPMFGKQNYHIVDGIDKENPHMVEGKEVRVVYDDGRHYIRTLPKDKKFDIITSDPIDPWVKGCAALNTVEYYEMCKAHLNPGGVMALWIPLYESDNETAKSVIATFFQVFPNGMFFSNDKKGKGFDAVLLAQVGPARIDLDNLHEKLNSPDYIKVKESLLEVGFGADVKGITWRPNMWGNPEISLLATYAGCAADMDEWTANAQINTDRNLRLQYLAGMSVNCFIAAEILEGILKYYRFPDDIFIGSSERVEEIKAALRTVNRTQ